MALPNIFSKEVCDEIINRINRLTNETQPLWGKMSVAQMLAHCSVTYEFMYTNKHKQPNAVTKFILKLLVKPIVTNELPYKQSIRTAPAFIIEDVRFFSGEKQRLINYILQTQALGADNFEGKESHSFGKLTKNEWNNMLYKHLDHHLRQFGV